MRRLQSSIVIAVNDGGTDALEISFTIQLDTFEANTRLKNNNKIAGLDYLSVLIVPHIIKVENFSIGASY